MKFLFIHLKFLIIDKFRTLVVFELGHPQGIKYIPFMANLVKSEKKIVKNYCLFLKHLKNLNPPPPQNIFFKKTPCDTIVKTKRILELSH